MQMHGRWKTKQIPIHRTGHAVNKGMHPFAHADDVGTHVFLACLFILRLLSHGVHQKIVKFVESRWTHALYILDAYQSP